MACVVEGVSVYGFYNYGHESVVGTAYFAALTIKDSCALNFYVYLVKPARYSVHLKAERRNTSGVDDIGGVCNNPDVSVEG